MSKQTGKYETAAVIDIASSGLRLKIAEKSADKIKTLETLIYPLNLGRDTFNTGKISFEKIDNTCRSIQNYLMKIKEFNVSKIRAIATTAVREATNKEYILDQIKIKTGLAFEVIDDKQEKIYIDKFVLNSLSKEYIESAMLVSMGSGNIGISVVEHGAIISTYSIRVGSLRISELFEKIMDYSSNYSLVLEEYLKSYVRFIEDNVPKGINHFIAQGNETNIILDLCNGSEAPISNIITKQSLSKIYRDIKSKTIENIMHDYNISEDRALVLAPTLIIFSKLFKMAKSDEVITSPVLLNDALLYEMLMPDKFKKISGNFEKNTIFSSLSIAKRFGCDEQHIDFVVKFALKIFDKLKKIHGLGERERIYLHTGCILHDIGKFVSARGHHLHSYNIVNGIDIVGLNVNETSIVANICYYHGKVTPTVNDQSFASLNEKDRLTVSKLSSIIRIANSLNSSHNPKFNDIDVKLSDGEIVITVQTSKNIELEQWAFYDKAVFFNEVFGIKATIKKKVI